MKKLALIILALAFWPISADAGWVSCSDITDTEGNPTPSSGKSYCYHFTSNNETTVMYFTGKCAQQHYTFDPDGDSVTLQVQVCPVNDTTNCNNGLPGTGLTGVYPYEGGTVRGTYNRMVLAGNVANNPVAAIDCE